jgi:hypothetical protein
MAAIARFLARRIPASDAESDVLKQLALLACAGLLVSFFDDELWRGPEPRFFLATRVLAELGRSQIQNRPLGYSPVSHTHLLHAV